MLVFIVTFLAWLSFIPETIQGRFLPIVKYLLLVLLLLSLRNHGFRWSRYFFNKESTFIWIYFVLISAGLVNAVDKNMAMGYYKDLVILGGSIYFLTKHTINKENCKIILRSLVIFSFIVAVIGILEMILGKNIIYHFIETSYYTKFIREKRIMSTLENPAILGHYLLTCAPLSCYFYSISEGRIMKRLYLIMSTIIIIALVLTFSRGAILGGLLVVSCYLWIKNKKKWIFAIMVVVILSSFLVLLLPYHHLRYRFGIGYLIRYLFHSHRTIQYFVTFNMLKAHPFLGVGLYNYRMLFDSYSSVRLPHMIMIPESTYLMHLGEGGILGFSAFISLLLVFLKRSITYLKDRFNNEEKGIFLFIFLGFIGLLFNMGTYDAFLWHTPFCLFWVFAGILSSFLDRGDHEIIK